MPTYAEYQAAKERQARKAVRDQHDEARHRQWDLQAQDRTAKFERFHFAVVGEGSRQAQDRYREGWMRIFGGA